MSESVYKGGDFEHKVRKQIEFYFSDSNLQTDHYLWKIYEANDGWVELKTILTFSRMRQFRPELKVIEAVEKSEKLKLSQNKDMISRTEPLKELSELKNIRKRNSVHVEGFPKDVSQEILEDWFNEKIVSSLPANKSINSIRRIKSKAKKFFGVVDVEFKTQEDADYFLNLIEVSYPQGIVREDEEDSSDKKTLLKKVSLLTFQEMRENGKRFGVNDVTKRRNSFNENSKGKNFKKAKVVAVEEKKEEQKAENSEGAVSKDDTETSVVQEDKEKKPLVEVKDAQNQ